MLSTEKQRVDIVSAGNIVNKEMRDWQRRRQQGKFDVTRWCDLVTVYGWAGRWWAWWDEAGWRQNQSFNGELVDARPTDHHRRRCERCVAKRHRHSDGRWWRHAWLTRHGDRARWWQSGRAHSGRGHNWSLTTLVWHARFSSTSTSRDAVWRHQKPSSNNIVPYHLKPFSLPITNNAYVQCKYFSRFVH